MPQIVCGLIMILSFTGALSVAEKNRGNGISTNANLRGVLPAAYVGIRRVGAFGG